MIKLSNEQIKQYFHRSYAAADGLWFMKVEDKYGFDVALDIDNEVWKVLPKIQARMLKSMGKMENGMDALFECLTTRLSLEGFKFEAEKDSAGKIFTVNISECPWHNAMIKLGREKLSEKVGTLVCNTEYSVWASEFGENISFELKKQICKGCKSCILHFSIKS